MKEIDYDWLKRLYDTHDKLERSIPINSKTSRCTKEILLDRYFKFLNGRAFKLKLPKNDGKYTTEDETAYEIYYALFNKVKHTTRSEDENRDGKVHYSYGVEKYNGWNDSEFIISFIDEKCNRQSFKLHWNGILRIKYEEITVEKYWEVVKLFVDTCEPEPNPPNYNNCESFDLAQGKYFCTSYNVSDKKCVGVECGFFNEKK